MITNTDFFFYSGNLSTISYIESRKKAFWVFIFKNMSRFGNAFLSLKMLFPLSGKSILFHLENSYKPFKVQLKCDSYVKPF